MTEIEKKASIWPAIRRELCWLTIPLGFALAAGLGSQPHGERFKRFYFNNVIGNPLETTIALHYLIFDGVLERHPNLKILAVHGGGYLGAYYGRIDHVWGARSDAHADLPKPPTTLNSRAVVAQGRNRVGINKHCHSSLLSTLMRTDSAIGGRL
jgi:hypothetical protein